MIILFLMILGVATIFSMIGLGGGILYVPILLQTGMNFQSAAATSLAIILVMSLTATFVYHRERLVDWYVLLLLEPFSIAGAFTMGYYAGKIPDKILFITFAVVSLISAWLMLHPPTQHLESKKKFPLIFKRTQGGQTYYINMWLGAPLSFIAGAISALLGIGGGFAKVPLMRVIFGMPVKSAVATSSAMIVITAATGMIGYSVSGYLDLKIIAILAIAVFIGANIGTRATIKINKKVLTYIFSGILVLVAGWMIYKAIAL